MRLIVILLAVAGLSACDRNSTDVDAPAMEATPAAVTFDGGDTRTEAARIAHGERLARVLGCAGCHGEDLQGERFYELYASNLTRELPKYSDAQFERLMRAGEHPAGRDVWGMPSEIFQHLSDPDLAALLAYVRSLPPAGGPTEPRLPFEPETKELIAAGEIKPAADFVREAKGLAPIELGSRYELGRYITRVTCAECHGPKLEGGGDTPDLLIAGAYSREDFEKLVTQGVPSGGRKLKKELMAIVAKGRFSRLTSHERDALYAYLKARAEQPQ